MHALLAFMYDSWRLWEAARENLPKVLRKRLCRKFLAKICWSTQGRCSDRAEDMRGKSPSNVAMFLWRGNFKRGGRVATASVRERFQLGSAESIIASREDNKAKGGWRGGGSNQGNVGSWDETARARAFSSPPCPVPKR